MRRTSWRVALLLLVAVLAAACGRGGDDADDADGASAADDGEESVLEVEEDPAPPSEPEPVTYEVQDGDTLSSIAAEHEVTIDDIVAANDLDDPDAIYPGDMLEIPQQSGDDDAGPAADDDAGDGAEEGSGDEAAGDAGDVDDSDDD